MWKKNRSRQIREIRRILPLTLGQILKIKKMVLQKIPEMNLIQIPKNRTIWKKEISSRMIPAMQNMK